MIPELFHLGPVAISPFGPAMVAAFVVAWAQLRWGLKRLGQHDEEGASALLLAAGVGGILGAKVYYALLYADWRLLFDRSGLVWYGGLVGGTLAVLWAARRRGMPLLAVVDAGAPAVAAGYAVGRIGCFLVGDDYGVATRLPWGVRFPYGLPFPTTAGNMRAFGGHVDPGLAADELVPVHPTQLYETAAALFVVVVCRQLLRRGVRPGATAVAGFGMLAAERFLVEFLRAKDDVLFSGFTLAQLISVALLAGLGWWWSRLRRREA
ncbi:MAG: prolipoprotein diacylglyceryl transferase [Acidobacteriota bacterium]|nr:prolipoprotein diacylglyceryl transferase [Acidobacteriota bacterium]MDH3524471.1 prolipoprotein diacylglyceryl transferase [Acidobacteriota bacterium]